MKSFRICSSFFVCLVAFFLYSSVAFAESENIATPSYVNFFQLWDSSPYVRMTLQLQGNGYYFGAIDNETWFNTLNDPYCGRYALFYELDNSLSYNTYYLTNTSFVTYIQLFGETSDIYLHHVNILLYTTDDNGATYTASQTIRVSSNYYTYAVTSGSSSDSLRVNIINCPIEIDNDVGRIAIQYFWYNIGDPYRVFIYNNGAASPIVFGQVSALTGDTISLDAAAVVGSVEEQGAAIVAAINDQTDTVVDAIDNAVDTVDSWGADADKADSSGALSSIDEMESYESSAGDDLASAIDDVDFNVSFLDTISEVNSTAVYMMSWVADLLGIDMFSVIAMLGMTIGSVSVILGGIVIVSRRNTRDPGDRSDHSSYIDIDNFHFFDE